MSAGNTMACQHYRYNYGEVLVVLSAIFSASESKISAELIDLHEFTAVLSLAALVVTVILFVHCCNDCNCIYSTFTEQGMTFDASRRAASIFQHTQRSVVVQNRPP